LCARAQARHRHEHLERQPRRAVAQFARQRDFVVHQALDARNRRRLHHEIRKRHFDATRLRFELREHRIEHRAKRGLVERRAVLVEQRDETRHVRAFLLGGQMHVEIPHANARLDVAALRAHGERITHALHAYALDRNLADVGRALHVGHHEGGIHLIHLVMSLRTGRVGRGGARCQRYGGMR
jgi:hypothetical protein